MSQGVSLYLDLIRCLAAIQVVLYHLPRLKFLEVELAWWNSYGHEAVIVFFVLSGYIITYAAEHRDRKFRKYCISRFVRIYSVVIPAVVLTVLLDYIGRDIQPLAYERFPESDRPLERVVISMLLINQSWNLDVQLFSNIPYWSITYEFWYYFIFGSVYFLRGWRRVIFVSVFSIIAGPKVLILFPIWILGSFAFKEKITQKWSSGLLVISALLVVPATVCYIIFGMPRLLSRSFIELTSFDLWRDYLSWSRYFLSDIYLGVFLALHLAAIKNFGAILDKIFVMFEKPIRWAAAYTFTLYLIHQPVALFIGAITSPLWELRAMPFLLVGLVVAITIVVGHWTERHRGSLARSMSTTIDKVYDSVTVGRAK